MKKIFKNILLILMGSILAIVLFKYMTNKEIKYDGFYGEWKIKDVVAFDKVASMPYEGAKKYMNSNIIYRKKQIIINDMVINNITYKVKSLSIRECEEYIARYIDVFDKKFKIKKNINLIRIYDGDNNLCRDLGGWFYLIDNETLVIYQESAYFRAIRK